MKTFFKKFQESIQNKNANEFWDLHIKNKCPLIEEQSNTQKTSIAHFFYQGSHGTENVFLHCGVTGDQLTPLKRLENTNYFHIFLELKNELRTLYSYVVNIDIVI